MNPTPLSPSDALAIAIGHHQAGRLAAAEQGYRQILARHPSQVDALHFLGVVALQTNRFGEAIAHCQQALTLKPDLLHAHIHLGHALRAQGNVEQAIQHYHQALALKLPEVCLSLGNSYYELKRYGEAIAQYQQALVLQPGLAIAHYNLGRLFQEQRQFEQAIIHYQHAIHHQPNYGEAYSNLGNVLMHQGRVDEAIAQYQQALRLRPNQAGIYVNLGKAVEARGDLDAAIPYYEQALSLNPDLAEVHNNLGDVRRDQNQMVEAIAHYQHAITLNPNLAEAHSNLGMAWLRVGNWQQGWAEFEWRWRCPDLSTPAFTQPVWDGLPLQGKTILLHSPNAEQGFGDAIQFIRYAPVVKAQGGRVVVECLPPLAGLFATVAGVDQIVVKGQELPPFDVQASLMSLPYLLKTSLATIPNSIPYLTPPQSSAIHLPPSTGVELNVGLVWAGKPLYANHPYRDRTCPLKHIAPLLELPGCKFYSLQTGARSADIAALGWHHQIQDLSHYLVDFADTAAAIAQLDLVISVDTAVAHLAGALGQTVWVLLPFAPEWRWMLDRNDSPWYPTMRLFRQPQSGDWQQVIQEVIHS